MNGQNEKALLIAVTTQAIKDYESDKYRDEAQSFIESDGFSWVWSELSDDMVGLPDVDTVRSRIAGGEVVIGRGAYH